MQGFAVNEKKDAENKKNEASLLRVLSVILRKAFRNFCKHCRNF